MFRHSLATPRNAATLLPPRGYHAEACKTAAAYHFVPGAFSRSMRESYVIAIGLKEASILTFELIEPTLLRRVTPMSLR